MRAELEQLRAEHHTEVAELRRGSLRRTRREAAEQAQLVVARLDARPTKEEPDPRES